jgi:non-ribosomal peptide synthetase component F
VRRAFGRPHGLPSWPSSRRWAPTSLSTHLPPRASRGHARRTPRRRCLSPTSGHRCAPCLPLALLDTVCWTAQGETIDALRRRSARAFVLGPDHLAYVNVTSGSTGEPKASPCPSAGSTTWLASRARTSSGVGPQDGCCSSRRSASTPRRRVAHGLLGGATSAPSRDTILDAARYERLHGQEGVTVATLPALYLPALRGRRLSSLHTLLVAGEPCLPAIAAELGHGTAALQRVRTHRGLGLPRCTSGDGAGPGSVPIGLPLATCSCTSSMPRATRCRGNAGRAVRRRRQLARGLWRRPPRLGRELPARPLVRSSPALGFYRRAIAVPPARERRAAILRARRSTVCSCAASGFETGDGRAALARHPRGLGRRW